VKIEPQIPSIWETLSYSRYFRGTLFDIEVKRGDGDKIIVDGKEQNDFFIEVPVQGLDRKRIKIEIQLNKN